jgi:hypothetical protein
MGQHGMRRVDLDSQKIQKGISKLSPVRLLVGYACIGPIVAAIEPYLYGGLSPHDWLTQLLYPTLWPELLFATYIVLWGDLFFLITVIRQKGRLTHPIFFCNSLAGEIFVVLLLDFGRWHHVGATRDLGIAHVALPAGWSAIGWLGYVWIGITSLWAMRAREFAIRPRHGRNADYSSLVDHPPGKPTREPFIDAVDFMVWSFFLSGMAVFSVLSWGIGMLLTHVIGMQHTLTIGWLLGGLLAIGSVARTKPGKRWKEFQRARQREPTLTECYPLIWGEWYTLRCHSYCRGRAVVLRRLLRWDPGNRTYQERLAMMLNQLGDCVVRCDH